jgi:tRNA modification GTPase
MLGDTILAQASAPGTSVRAVLRLSGPAALAAAALVFEPPLPEHRAVVDGVVRVRAGQVPAMALVMRGPRSFTGEDTVELHVPGGPLLVQLLQQELLAHGAGLGVRAALPGEFTARACRNGRLDPAQAEGVLLLLHAADRQQAAAAVQWLRGGLSAAVAAVRSHLQDALAGLEAGLDFTDDETGGVPSTVWAAPLATAAAQLAGLAANLPVAAPGGEVLLLGAANAGKSSLANALAGRAAALVDAVPGTTRDLLRIEIAPGVAVWDAPGDLVQAQAADAAALALRDRLAGRAAAVVVVLDAVAPQVPGRWSAIGPPLLAIVWTRCDLVAEPPPLPAELAPLVGRVPVLATSSRTGAGVAAFRGWLAQRAHGGAAAPGAPLRDALDLAAAAVGRVREAAVVAPETAAVDLQAALRALDDVDGGHSPEHVLDRIYGRFCLGK